MQGEYSAIYRDVFNFHKERTRRLRNSESFWNETASGMERIARDHENAPFCMELLCAVMAELERQAAA